MSSGGFYTIRVPLLQNMSIHTNVERVLADFIEIEEKYKKKHKEKWYKGKHKKKYKDLTLQDWRFVTKKDDNKVAGFNFHLLFSRCSPIKNNLPEKYHSNFKLKWLELLILQAKNMLNKHVQHLQQRQKRLTKELRSAGYHCREFTCRVEWRLIVGLGAVHPHETSMILHHLYGVPYIPGSAVKGVTRYYAKNYEHASENEVTEVFGMQSKEKSCAGRVIFLDALPADSESFKLEVDIMNPHYLNYYQGDEPPADWQDPTPIPFLVIGKDTRFTFRLLSRYESLLQRAEEWLRYALKKIGIGAKTAVGYGFFRLEENF